MNQHDMLWCARSQSIICNASQSCVTHYMLCTIRDVTRNSKNEEAKGMCKACTENFANLLFMNDVFCRVLATRA